jgi:F-type H+-transporting ATPase subunit delta
MLNLSKIRYYAKALFEVGKEEGKDNQIIDDLVLVNVIFQSEKELKDYILNPEIKLEEKKIRLKDIFGEKIQEYTYNFVFELVEREEFELLSLIIERLKVLVYQEGGIVEAEITSAVELNDSAKSDILKKIEKKTGKSVKLITKIDSNLLGGMKVKIGDEMVDLSVRGRLEGLRNSIIE